MYSMTWLSLMEKKLWQIAASTWSAQLQENVVPQQYAPHLVLTQSRTSTHGDAVCTVIGIVEKAGWVSSARTGMPCQPSRSTCRNAGAMVQPARTAVATSAAAIRKASVFPLHPWCGI
ncbi:hypothetical protein V8Z74_05260 [Comamonas sp. w2-DMI]|uniref:hypothetical protein n=1 Tax=Comamonas sp. w2-DMI TaxID=3126391 RepID=UPI0032E39A5B